LTIFFGRERRRLSSTTLVLLIGARGAKWSDCPCIRFEKCYGCDDEDRSRIRKGHGPANITRLRRFALGILKSIAKPRQTVAELLLALTLRPRRVFDLLRMTRNSNPYLSKGVA